MMLYVGGCFLQQRGNNNLCLQYCPLLSCLPSSPCGATAVACTLLNIMVHPLPVLLSC
jgi:hypothetical protein